MNGIQRLWHQRHLIVQLVRRDIAIRYRGSIGGIGWSILLPIANLSVFVFVFEYVFGAKWPGAAHGTAAFAVQVFAGLMVYNFFAECIGKAPGLIVATPNYVKKVVFPLELIPLATVVSALFHLAVTLVVFLATSLVVEGRVPVTTFWFPVVLAPLVIVVLGLCWFLAAVGVFIRDMQHLVSALLPPLMFLSPIFYPITNIPEKYRWLLYANPLTPVVEQTRRVLVDGKAPQAEELLTAAAYAFVVLLLALIWFRRSRSAFAEAL